MTYASNPELLNEFESYPNFIFEHTDINDIEFLYECDYIINTAAETHVGNSLVKSENFVHSNISGVHNLLELIRNYRGEGKDKPTLLHFSTDEVYGDLEGPEDLFTESSPYAPSSPYSASKASSDHLVRAWLRTYDFPTLISNCSNNYGPYHFPEKLIPLMILNALEGKPLPVYGEGTQVRDWLYVEDHTRALYKIVTEGKVGETYNIGGHNEKQNIEVVHALCDLLDELVPEKPEGINRYRELVVHVQNRPGHDLRYAIDASKIQRDLGWTPEETFETGIRKTVQWYLENSEWCQRVQDGSYRRERLGTGESI